jgi:GTPase SAR1 family protein
MSNKLKIVVVGPKKGGKSTLANVLGDFQTTNDLSAPYFPTLGVRIVEISVENIPVELWEIAGDLNFKQYWTALAEKANGCIYVFADGQADDLLPFMNSGVFTQKNALIIQTCKRGKEPEVPKKLTPLRIYDDDILAIKPIVSPWIRNYFIRSN